MGKYLYILVTLTLGGCFLSSCLECRCKEPEQQALSMPKDEKLVGIWCLDDEKLYVGNPNWMSFDKSGICKFGDTREFVENTTYFDIWYTVESTLYTYHCVQYNPMTTKYPYVVKDDTLRIVLSEGSDVFHSYIREK